MHLSENTNRYSVAEQAINERNYTLAVTEYARLVAKAPSSRALSGLASAKLELGDDIGAIESANIAVEHDPNCGAAYSVLGKAHISAGNDHEGLAALLRAMELYRRMAPSPPNEYTLPAHSAAVVT